MKSFCCKILCVSATSTSQIKNRPALGNKRCERCIDGTHVRMERSFDKFRSMFVIV